MCHNIYIYNRNRKIVFPSLLAIYYLLFKTVFFAVSLFVFYCVPCVTLFEWVDLSLLRSDTACFQFFFFYIFFSFNFFLCVWNIFNILIFYTCISVQIFLILFFCLLWSINTVWWRWGAHRFFCFWHIYKLFVEW